MAIAISSSHMCSLHYSNLPCKSCAEDRKKQKLEEQYNAYADLKEIDKLPTLNQVFNSNSQGRK